MFAAIAGTECYTLLSYCSADRGGILNEIAAERVVPPGGERAEH
jgi:hypothetical protein